MGEAVAITISQGKVLLDKVGEEYIFPAYWSNQTPLLIAHELVEDYLGISPNWATFHFVGDIDGRTTYLVLVQEPIPPKTNISQWVDIVNLPNLAGNINNIVKYLTKVVGQCQS